MQKHLLVIDCLNEKTSEVSLREMFVGSDIHLHTLDLLDARIVKAVASSRFEAGVFYLGSLPLCINNIGLFFSKCKQVQVILKLQEVDDEVIKVISEVIPSKAAQLRRNYLFKKDIKELLQGGTE